MELIWIYLTFARIGLFTIGGGMAALPLLHAEMVGGGLIDAGTFIDMVAVSQSTPGPIGINMATYAGYTLASGGGALVATMGMVTPSLIIIMLIARFLQDFAHHRCTVAVLGCLRPTAVGLIAAAAWFVLRQSVFATGVPLAGAIYLDWQAALLAIALGLARYRWKLHPIAIILAGGAIGIAFF